MRKLTLRSLWDHKRRLVLTLVSIVLGVSFMSGTFVLSDTLDRLFDDLFAEGNENVDVQVQGELLFADPFGGGDQRELLAPEVVEQVAQVDGVRVAEPRVLAFGSGSSNRVLGADGDAIGASQGPPTLIESWIDGSELTPYVIAEGRGPAADDELALNVAAADDGDVTVGDKVTIVTQFGPKEYTLVGTVLFGSAESSAGAVSAEVTLAEAQRLAGTDGKVQQVLAAAEDGVSQEELATAVQSALGEGPEVLTGVEAAAELSSDVQSGFSFFTIALQIFGAIALLVGAFVISNTFSIIVQQRTRELALLRAVGASRRQVLTSVVLEAIVVGLVGAAVGLGFGVLLAKGVTAVLDAVGADLPTNNLVLTPQTIVSALIIGLVVTLMAALTPAIRATRVPPLAALRDVAIDRSGASRIRIGLGILIAAFAALNLSAAWIGDGSSPRRTHRGPRCGAADGRRGHHRPGPCQPHRPPRRHRGGRHERHHGQAGGRERGAQPEAHVSDGIRAHHRRDPRRVHHGVRGVGQGVHRQGGVPRLRRRLRRVERKRRLRRLRRLRPHRGRRRRRDARRRFRCTDELLPRSSSPTTTATPCRSSSPRSIPRRSSPCSSPGWWTDGRPTSPTTASSWTPSWPTAMTSRSATRSPSCWRVARRSNRRCRASPTTRTCSGTSRSPAPRTPRTSPSRLMGSCSGPSTTAPTSTR